MQEYISQNIDSENTNVKNEKLAIDIAKTFKWYIHSLSPNFDVRIPVHRMTAVSLYKKHKKIFDKFAELVQKTNIDYAKYIQHFICDLNFRENDIDSSLLTMNMYDNYIEYLKSIKRRTFIYDDVLKTIKFIAQYCVKNDIMTAHDFFRHMISEKKLASYYLAGKLSRYYLAAIPKFDKVIVKLDHFAKDELNDIVQMHDVYVTETNKSFLAMKNCKCNPIKMTDLAISKLRQKQ